METVTGATTQRLEPESHGRRSAGKPPGLDQTPPQAEPAGNGERRSYLARITPALRVALQNRVIMPLLDGDGDIAPLWSLKLRTRFPALRRLRPR
jgi:hypothetical protein